VEWTARDTLAARKLNIDGVAGVTGGGAARRVECG
jgi:hypothetical protein